MSDLVDDQLDSIDFAVAAFHEDGAWEVQEVTYEHLESIETFAQALRRLPGDAGALGMLAVDEEFFVLVRVSGSQTRVLLSDVTASLDWEIAQSAVDFLRMPDPEEEDDAEPAGDLGIVADLGLPAMEMGALLDDDDAYPDELLSDIARQLGFGAQFDDVVGLDSA